MERSVEDKTLYHGADAASDHHLIVTKIKLKPHENPDRAMEELTHKSSKRKCSNQNSALKYATDLQF